MVTGLIIAAAGMIFLIVQLITTFAIPSLPPAPRIDIVTDIVTVLIGAVTVWLVRSVRIRLAAWVVIGCLLIAATTQLSLRGRPSTDVVGAFGLMMVVALSIVLLDQRRAWMAITAAAAVALIGVHILWLSDLLPPPVERGQNLPGQAMFSIVSWGACTAIILVVIGSTVSILRDQAEALRLRIAERKQVEEALRSSQTMLKIILQNMPGGILLIGEDYKIHQVNNRTCEITGYAEEELVGSLCDIVCPKGAASKACPIWAKGRDGFSGMDTAIKCKGGHKTPILKNAQRITIGDQQYILESFQDITERKQAEEQLSFQSMLLDQIYDMVTATDLEGRITYVNQAECRAFGKPADDFIGQHVEHYGDVPDQGATQQEIIETTRSEGQWRGEVVNIAEDGREIVLDCRTQLVYDENGEPIGMLGISTDITKRKQTEAALRESEARYRAVVEDQTEFICRFQSRGTLTFVNRAYGQYFDKEPGDLIGHGIVPLILEEDRELVRQEFSSLSPEHPVANYECRVVKPDGEVRWHEWTERAFFDETGEVTEYQSVGRDITERKEMEQQLQRQERLAAVGQLAAGIAHDFRNLLSTIILYAQLPMRDRDLPPDLTQSLQTIVDESYKATNLVQQILDFSSRAMIKRQPLDLAALTREVLNVLKRTIPEHIQLTLDVQNPDSGAYTVEADSGRIQQALTNLTLNARDAMPEGGDLRFALSQLAVSDDEPPPVADMSPGDWVCLSVSDTGTGMTKEVQEHIFEPFFTTKDVDNGTGLGLAQVYGIVRQHKGHIDVETEPGAGTTFYIYLPAYGEEIEEEDATENASDLPQGRGETILLVEDEKKLREAGRAMLESLDYRVVTAANGREALAKCQLPRWSGERARPIKLVITDLVMPEMSGEDLMHELQKRKPDLPVLVITGYALQEDDLQALKDMGFMDVIFKPFEVQALAQAVHCALAS
jgi:PAS domain S-box-containing protein